MDLHKKSVARAYAHIGRTQYQTIAGSGKHAIVVDEPESVHGTDTAMGPFPLLLSSLGSCTIITLRMYIERKMWIVDEIKVELELFSIDGGHLIERKLSFKGDLTPEQLKRLEEIADACPVHKMLTGSIMIETEILA
ncbi:OsmC family protein [Mucilaginibacter lacusdianchii]|uniref:OsmC family protein n=1 Tax=Mucilaginibacter lacusdianchii TaxID=2684211 RepID=UPI00131C7A8A|nr:OsmC family protein [Mucilaginibacter sp. JXJ CY 39]